jgi:hypothetical protein
MSRLPAIIAAVACAALGSCVASPAAPGFAWSYQNNVGEGPKLAYGAPSSDNVVLMMTCEPAARRVDVSLMGGSPHGGLVLTSGDARQTVPAGFVAAPGAGQMIEGSTHIASPALARFARTGDLSLVDRGRTVSLAATPMDRASVNRFFAACSA